MKSVKTQTILHLNLLNHRLVIILCIDFSVWSLLGTLLMERICWWVPQQVRDDVFFLEAAVLPDKAIHDRWICYRPLDKIASQMKSAGVRMRMILLVLWSLTRNNCHLGNAGT